MKKRTICLLLALLLAALLPVQTLATESPASGGAITYYGRNALANFELEYEIPGIVTMYGQMYAAAKKSDSAEIELAGMPIDLVDLVFRTMRSDHPELFWLRDTCRIESSDGESADAFALCFYEYEKGLETAKEKFEAAAAEVLKDSFKDKGELTDYEKEFHLHNTLLERLSHADDSTDQGAYSALVSGAGNSAGYAAAFQYLLQKEGISSFVVTNAAEDTPFHAWNMVQIDGSWYFVDPYWDDKYVDGLPYISHEYFNISAARMEALGYAVDSTFGIEELVTYDCEEPSHLDYDLHYHNIEASTPDLHVLSCRCGDQITGAHSFGERTILSASTCTKKGTYSQICETCRYLGTGTIPMLDHSYGEDVADENDRITRTCTACNATDTRSAFTNSKLEGRNISVTGYEGIYRTDIKIPEKIGSFFVTKIGGGAFQGRSDLTCIRIPYGVTAIGEYAFSGCDSLADIYYGGNEDQWKQISIASHNEALGRARVHYEDTRLLLDIKEKDATVALVGEDTTYTLGMSGGWYTLDNLPLGTYTLRVEKEGYVPYQQEIIYEGKGALLSFRLLQPGNINGEGGDAADAVDMQQMYGYLIGTVTITDPYLLQVADVNGDNAVDVYDLQRLYEAVSGIRAF